MVALFKALMPAGTSVSRVYKKEKGIASVRGYHPFFDDKDYLMHITDTGAIRVSPNTYINPAKLIKFIGDLGYSIQAE